MIIKNPIGVPDELVEEYVSLFKENFETEKKQEEIRQAEQKRKEAEIPNILITSGFSFDGYKITKYSGYISGDDAIQLNRDSIGLFFRNGQFLTDALSQIRIQALKELRDAAYD